MLELAGAGVVTASALWVTVGVMRIAAGQPGDTAIAVAATSAYLPLHLWHVQHALRGRRPAGAAWSLALMAVVIVATLPVIGVQWLAALYPLSASVLLLLRPRWSIPLFAGLVALPGVAAVMLGGQQWVIYFSAGVLLYGLVLAVPVWLIATIRELRAARTAVADQAVVRERTRVEDELRHTLGSALETIAGEADLAARRIGAEPGLADAALRTVIGTARNAVAEGRRLTAGFRPPALRTELESAATLLRTAGIRVRLVVPDELPEPPPHTLLAALHAEVSRLLQSDGVRDCTIEIVDHGGDTRLVVAHRQSGTA
ncbi:histidine kinase [Micromonospora sp. CB01531]|uniref:histidine kinase n=1 Tax=Micromonospora sp. CB01531 TaxID=1718947 RepID=UPI0009388FAF|nr:histidine kinase [Micromonospora sp. CB01531]OKI41211.1 hypothetical protein A6A27_39405 [Micromonospora sp. CB01531]